MPTHEIRLGLRHFRDTEQGQEEKETTRREIVVLTQMAAALQRFFAAAVLFDIWHAMRHKFSIQPIHLQEGETYLLIGWGVESLNLH